MIFCKQKILSFILSSVFPCCYPRFENQQEEGRMISTHNLKKGHNGIINIKKNQIDMYTKLQFSSNAYLGSLSIFSLIPYFPESHLGIYGLLSIIIGWFCYPSFEKISWHLLNPHRIVHPNHHKGESLSLYKIVGKDVLSRFALLVLITYSLMLSSLGSPIFLMVSGLLTRLLLESQFSIFRERYLEMTDCNTKIVGDSLY